MNERPKFRLKSPPRRKGKLKNARVTKRELNRHRAKESSPNNCAKRAIKGTKNLGMELSLTFKLSVRHIVCVCVPTAQIFVKSVLKLRKSHTAPFCHLNSLQKSAPLDFSFVSLFFVLLFPTKTSKCIKTRSTRRAHQKREKRERMDFLSSSSSDDDDTVGGGVGDKSLDRKKKKKTGLRTSELLSKREYFDTSQFLTWRGKEMIERGKKTRWKML